MLDELYAKNRFFKNDMKHEWILPLWKKSKLYDILANIHLDEDVLKTSSRRLQCNIFLSSKTSWRHNCKTSRKHVLKTSWRRFRKTYCKYVLKTYSRGLGRRKVLRWRRLQVVLKTSWKTRNVFWDHSIDWIHLSQGYVEPLQGETLPSSIKSPGLRGTHLIDLG